MNCTKDELDEYQKFVMKSLKRPGCFEISGHDVLWHYTDGIEPNCLSFVRSGI